MNQQELKDILDKHRKWLSGSPDGKRANLSDANLSDADLSGANLSDANLSEKEKCRKGVILKEDRIAYKKCCNHIVRLLIPKGAIVFAINNNKCRTNKAYVIEILTDSGEKSNMLALASNYDCGFEYKVGEVIEIEDFCLEYNVEGATGIHFFWDFESAKNYKY